MKHSLILITVIFLSNLSFGQKTIHIDSVKNHVGEIASVCSKVYGVKTTDKVTYINLGAAYPKSPLAIVIFAKDLINFKSSPSQLYSDKQICVIGTIKEYKGKLEIIVTKPDEIVVKE